MPTSPPPVMAPGEDLAVLERVVVAPSRGVFTPLPPETVATEGDLVRVGQAIGTIESSGSEVSVHSPFDGFMMGMLAARGERVREGEPVAWLRALPA